MLTYKFPFLFLFACSLLLSACGGDSGSAQDQSKEGMGQFGEDEKFKEAHEKPKEISFTGTGEMHKFATPDGKEGQAYYLKAAEASDKYLFVIHEWYGLNDHIKQEAERYYAGITGVNVMALDLYDGQVTANPDEAGKIMQSIKQERAEAIIKGALAEAGANAKVATVGWCFGGGWSLRSSILAGKQGVGCVMYYGMPVQKADELLPLEAEVLGLFAEKDGWITPKVANSFEALAKATGKTVSIHQFDAEHAFANPSGERYNEEAAQKANAMSMAFLKEKL